MNFSETDRFFPGFSMALDTEIVKKEIEKFVQKDKQETSLESCQTSDVRCDPGSECILLYRLNFVDRVQKVKWEQFYMGKILKVDEAPRVSKEAFFSEKMKTVFIPFPYDPCMPWLAQAANAKAMKEKLTLVIPKEKWRIIDFTIKTLAYVPQMRATFLYSVGVEGVQSGEVKNLEWIAKTNVSKLPQRVYPNYWALWSASEGKIPMPKPTGFLLQPQLTFQERINGIRLGAIVDAPHINQLMEDVAKGIANFHNSKIPLTNTRKLEQEIKNLSRWGEVLMNLRPDLQKRVESLKGQIISKMSQSFIAESPIHADFHHTNILIDGAQVNIIDMDEVAYGDPCVDVGRFLSSLRIPSLRAFGSFDGLKSQRELFVETYLKHSPREQKKIHLFEAASLFTSAASTFRMQRRNWENEIPMLIEESEEAFRKSQKPSIQSVSYKMESVKLSKLDCIKWIKDEEYIKSLLAPHFYKKFEREIQCCKLLDHRLKNGYQAFAYLVISYEGVDKFEDTIDLFMHETKDGRYAYRYAEFLFEKMKNQLDALHFPEPIAYLSEINVLAFFQTKGDPFAIQIGSTQSLIIAEKLAKGLALFYKLPLAAKDEFLNGSYILKNISLNKFKFFGERLCVEFPLRKSIGNSDLDIDHFVAKLRAYAQLENKVEACEQFIEYFLKKNASCRRH